VRGILGRISKQPTTENPETWDHPPVRTVSFTRTWLSGSSVLLALAADLRHTVSLEHGDVAETELFFLPSLFTELTNFVVTLSKGWTSVEAERPETAPASALAASFDRTGLVRAMAVPIAPKGVSAMARTMPERRVSWYLRFWFHRMFFRARWSGSLLVP
jgi:hypothetical protein